MYVNDIPFGETRLTYGLFGTHAARFVAQILLLAWLFGLAKWHASAERAAKAAGEEGSAITTESLDEVA